LEPVGGGRRLHVVDVGAGAPAVVILPGGGNVTLDWTPVYRAVSEFTRTCVVDRAGYAWSDPAPEGHGSPEAVIADARAALRSAGVEPPWVLVGHSLGGLYARRFAEEHPAEVAGLVFLDSSHELQVPWLLDAGVTPILDEIRKRAAEGPPPGLEERLAELRPDLNPEEVQQLAEVHLARSKALAVQQEVAWLESAAPGYTRRPLPAVPVRVLMRGRPDPLPGLDGEALRKLDEVWLRCQREIAGGLAGCEVEPVEGSGHMLMYDRPDAVVEAVRSVWKAARRAGGEET
jgi:pimeloyl-ACP methyl ester carboxylesterase